MLVDSDVDILGTLRCYSRYYEGKSGFVSEQIVGHCRGLYVNVTVWLYWRLLYSQIRSFISGLHGVPGHRAPVGLEHDVHFRRHR